MTYQNARKLHNEDEVTDKRTGQILTVLDAYETTHPVTNKPQMTIEAVTDDNTYVTCTHRDIK